MMVTPIQSSPKIQIQILLLVLHWAKPELAISLEFIYSRRMGQGYALLPCSSKLNYLLTTLGKEERTYYHSNNQFTSIPGMECMKIHDA